MITRFPHPASAARHRQLAGVLPALLCCLLLVILARGFWSYTVDDAFITFRYARNLVAGLGPVFNAGEHTEGYTNFLWLLLMSLGEWARLDVVLWSKTLGLACAIATALVLYWAAPRALELPRTVGLAAMLGVAGCTELALNSVTGLETALYTLLLTLAVLRGAYELRHGGRPYAALCFALAALTRPEPLLLFAVHGLFPLVARRQSLRHVAGRAWPFALLIGLHLLARLGYYGDPFPATYYAKLDPLAPRLAAGRVYLTSWVGSYGLLLLAGIPLALRRLRGPNKAVDYRLCYVATIALAGLAVVVWEGGDWMVGRRFLVPLVPLLALLTSATLLGRLRLAVTRWEQMRTALLASTISALYLAINLAALPALYHYTSVRAAGYQAAHRQVAMWLAAEYPPGAAVALMDVGIIGYYTDLRIIDITGLTDATIAHAPGGFLTKRYDSQYVLGQSPVAIVLVTTDEDDEPDYAIDRRLWAAPGFAPYALAHSFDHYRDPQLGIYRLLLFRRAPATALAQEGDGSP